MSNDNPLPPGTPVPPPGPGEFQAYVPVPVQAAPEPTYRSTDMDLSTTAGSMHAYLDEIFDYGGATGEVLGQRTLYSLVPPAQVPTDPNLDATGIIAITPEITTKMNELAALVETLLLQEHPNRSGALRLQPVWQQLRR
jgi:hypothetical protein